MKPLKALLISAILALPLPCLALTVAQTVGQVKGTNPSSAFTASVASGTVVVAIIECGDVGGSPISTAVADNVSSGAYTLLGEQFDSVSHIQNDTYWKIANATGTPTVTLTAPSGYCSLSLLQVIGFTGTPTADTAIANTAAGSTATVAINATSTQNNEIMIANAFSLGGYFSATPTGWSANLAGGTYGGWDAIEASSGTANNLSATLSAAGDWAVILGGIYDAAAAPAFHSGGFALSPSN